MCPVGRLRCYGAWSTAPPASVAQWRERGTSNPEVAGSNPAGGAGTAHPWPAGSGQGSSRGVGGRAQGALRGAWAVGWVRVQLAIRKLRRVPRSCWRRTNQPVTWGDAARTVFRVHEVGRRGVVEEGDGQVEGGADVRGPVAGVRIGDEGVGVVARDAADQFHAGRRVRAPIDLRVARWLSSGHEASNAGIRVAGGRRRTAAAGEFTQANSGGGWPRRA